MVLVVCVMGTHTGMPMSTVCTSRRPHSWCHSRNNFRYGCSVLYGIVPACCSIDKRVLASAIGVHAVMICSITAIICSSLILEDAADWSVSAAISSGSLSSGSGEEHDLTGHVSSRSPTSSASVERYSLAKIRDSGAEHGCCGTGSGATACWSTGTCPFSGWGDMPSARAEKGESGCNAMSSPRSRPKSGLRRTLPTPALECTMCAYECWKAWAPLHCSDPCKPPKEVWRWPAMSPRWRLLK